MSNFKNIDLATARGMSKGRLTVEIGKRSKYLKEELGMNSKENAEFISSLLNIGVAMQDIFDREKAESNNK